MRIKIELFVGIVLFFCFVVTGFFGASIALSSDDLINPRGSDTGGNVWYGEGAGGSIRFASDNSFFGMSAGSLTTDGNSNSFFGKDTGFKNTTGYANSFFGSGAGIENITGEANSFFGMNAGYNNTTGYANSFFGRYAGYHNNGYRNTFVGMTAGYENIGGYDNTFLGMNAGHKNLSGNQNTFLGRAAGYANNAGNYNTFVGYGAGNLNNSGSDNTFIGHGAGWTNTNGSGNVFLGYKAGYQEKGHNKLYVDNSNINNPLIWGDFENRNIIIYGNFRAIATSSSSDGRWKKNIRPLESSLDKISNLQGVSYEWKVDEYPDFGLMEGKQIGLVAQDVEKEIPELVSEDKDGYKAVSYTKLTAVLVEAVKELKSENQSQKKLIEEQRNQFTKQQAEIEELRSMIKASKG